MNREIVEEQSALHALGLLEREDRRELFERLESDEEARRLSRDLRDVTVGLALTVEQVDPPASLRARVLAALPEQRPVHSPRISAFPGEAARPAPSDRASNIIPLFKYVPWAVAAGLALTCGLLVQSNTRLRSEVVALESEAKMDTLRIAVLSSMVQGSPDARAVAVWNGERQEGLLTVEGLPPVPQDKDYQLWVIDPQYEIPVDGGVFRTDQAGRLRYVFHPEQPVSSANVFAVSLERSGGVPKAEGPMVLISSR